LEAAKHKPDQQLEGKFHSSPFHPRADILVVGCEERQPHLKPFNDFACLSSSPVES